MSIAQIKKSKNEAIDEISVIILADRFNVKKKRGFVNYLTEVNNKKLIDIQLGHIVKRFKSPEIILCINRDQQEIIDYVKKKHNNKNIKFVENRNSNITNDSESLRLCLNNNSRDKVCIFNANTILSNKHFSVVDFSFSGIITERNNKQFDVGIVSQNERVEHFSFGLESRWLGVLWLNESSIIEKLRLILSQEKYEKKFIFEALNELLNNTKHKIYSKNNNSSTIKRIGE